MGGDFYLQCIALDHEYELANLCEISLWEVDEAIAKLGSNSAFFGEYHPKGLLGALASCLGRFMSTGVMLWKVEALTCLGRFGSTGVMPWTVSWS